MALLAKYKRIWGAVATIMNAVAVTTGSSSTNVDLETLGYEAAQVEILADFPVSPTDDLDGEIQTALDGTTYNDALPLFPFSISKDNDPAREPLIVRDVAHFRVFVKRSGSTDTITVTIKVKPFMTEAHDS